jgi:hypothetical protein
MAIVSAVNSGVIESPPQHASNSAPDLTQIAQPEFHVETVKTMNNNVEEHQFIPNLNEISTSIDINVSNNNGNGNNNDHNFNNGNNSDSPYEEDLCVSLHLGDRNLKRMRLNSELDSGLDLNPEPSPDMDSQQ